jgi:hypothetical protein
MAVVASKKQTMRIYRPVFYATKAEAALAKRRVLKRQSAAYRAELQIEGFRDKLLLKFERRYLEDPKKSRKAAMNRALRPYPVKSRTDRSARRFVRAALAPFLRNKFMLRKRVARRYEDAVLPVRPLGRSQMVDRKALRKVWKARQRAAATFGARPAPLVEYYLPNPEKNAIPVTSLTRGLLNALPTFVASAQNLPKQDTGLFSLLRTLRSQAYSAMARASTATLDSASRLIYPRVISYSVPDNLKDDLSVAKTGFNKMMYADLLPKIVCTEMEKRDKLYNLWRERTFRSQVVVFSATPFAYATLPRAARPSAVVQRRIHLHHQKVRQQHVFRLRTYLRSTRREMLLRGRDSRRFMRTLPYRARRLAHRNFFEQVGKKPAMRLSGAARVALPWLKWPANAAPLTKKQKQKKARMRSSKINAIICKAIKKETTNSDPKQNTPKK